jgi:hypothetical protein
MPRRKDGIFAKVDCRILTGQRFNALKIYDQAVYLKLWILAVRERTACFPACAYAACWIARTLSMTQREYKKSIARIAAQALIEILPDGSLIVNDVMECHAGLDWKQVHLTSLPCTELGTQNVPKQVGDIRSEDNRYKIPDSGGVTTSTVGGTSDEHLDSEGAPEDGQTARPDPDPDQPDGSSEPLTEPEGEDEHEPWKRVRNNP